MLKSFDQINLYHLIEQSIKNKKNFRLNKLVEQFKRRHRIFAEDLVQDAWIEAQTYPHTIKPNETDIQTVSRFCYNFLRRKLKTTTSDELFGDLKKEELEEVFLDLPLDS